MDVKELKKLRMKITGLNVINSVVSGVTETKVVSTLLDKALPSNIKVATVVGSSLLSGTTSKLTEVVKKKLIQSYDPTYRTESDILNSIDEDIKQQKETRM